MSTIPTGALFRRSLNYLIYKIHGTFRDMEILISLMLYIMIPTEIKTPSTVMVLGAYVKKRRDIFIDARRYMKHEAR